MADLSALGQHDRSDRAQLILVTAFALAAIFLGLAIIVNSAIFTENLATRSENVESTEALEYRQSVAQFTAGVVEYANENNATNEEDIWRNVSDGIRELNEYNGIQQAQNGAAIALEFNNSENGSRIFQTDGTSFESNSTSGTPDWTLATDVDRTRAFEINASSISGTFHVIANDTSDPATEWVAEINGTAVEVTRPGGGTDACTVGSVETVDLTNAQVNGTACPALRDTTTGESLQFAVGVGDGYAIEFENPDIIEGNYNLVVDNTSLDANTNDNYRESDEPGNGPRVTPAMYSATVELQYETPRVEYRTLVRVAPGESK